MRKQEILVNLKTDWTSDDWNRLSKFSKLKVRIVQVIALNDKGTIFSKVFWSCVKDMSEKLNWPMWYSFLYNISWLVLVDGNKNV